MPDGLLDFLRGGTMVACFGIALFFFRIGRANHEQLFVMFSAAFSILGFSQTLSLFWGELADTTPATYWLRLVSFVLIIVGIVRKNLPIRSTKRPDEKS